MKQQELKEELLRTSTSCELPDQLETPYERVRSYVKEQSDPLHQNLSSPRVSGLFSDHSQVTGTSSATPLVVSSSNSPVLSSLGTTTFAHGPRQLQPFRYEPSANVRQASSNAAFSQNVHHPCQSSPLYTFPFNPGNPMNPTNHPRVSVSSMSAYPNNPATQHCVPSVSEDYVMQPLAPDQNDEPLLRLADLLTERHEKR